MITLFKFGFLFCVIIQLAMIDHTLQQSLETIRLYNESKYPLTSSDSVKGYTLKATDQKQTVPLHNGEVKQ